LNQCIDILVEYRNNFAKGSPQLSTPPTLHLLPLFTFALIKNPVIRAGEMRSDERSYAMNLLRTLPVSLSEPLIYPRLFNISNMPPHVVVPDANGELTLPPTLELQSENIARDQAYLLDDGQSLYLWVGKLIPADFLHQVFGVSSHEALDTSAPVSSSFSSSASFFTFLFLTLLPYRSCLLTHQWQIESRLWLVIFVLNDLSSRDCLLLKKVMAGSISSLLYSFMIARKPSPLLTPNSYANSKNWWLLNLLLDKRKG
jgi:hypothetical protein